MTKPLRIGLLTPSFAGVTGLDSGIGVHFRHLADALTAAGCEVRAVVVTESAASPQALPYPVQIVAVPVQSAARLVGRFSWQLHQWIQLRAQQTAAARSARATTADIWETTSTGALTRLFLAQRARCPVVVRVSTTAAQLRTTNAGRAHWINRRLEKWEAATVRGSDRVFTHARSHRDVIAHDFCLSPADIPIVPHGIPVPPAVTRHAEPDRCHLLFVGRLEHRKGIDLLLAALPDFLHAIPQARVTLIGRDPDGYWQRRWLHQASGAEAARVSFTGLVDSATLTAHYRDADLFVAPSRYESFGLVFVEAMAQSLPVIALRTSGASDIIEPDVTGCLVPADQPAALAAALISLARDPARRDRLGVAARREVELRYSLPALAAASVAFYTETLHGNAVKT